MALESNVAVRAAGVYTARRWPVFPVGHDKRPLTSHGRSDATLDMAIIVAWLRRWPKALIGIATGAESGLVVVDIDVRPEFSGFDSLELLGVDVLPSTPIVHSPAGGIHLYFAHPGRAVKTIAGKLGRGIDIRGDGGSIIAPPGPGRRWDDCSGLDVELAPYPAWAIIPEPLPPVHARSIQRKLDRYSEAALDSAVKAILAAPAGQQRETLNRETFAIGGLVAAGSIPAALAQDALKWAARQMPAYDPRRPWTAADLDRKVEGALLAGMRHPRRRA